MDTRSDRRLDDDVEALEPTEAGEVAPTQAAAAGADFTMALRGYDRLQVDDYIERQGHWAAEMEARLAAAERRAEHHAAQAAALQERVDALAEVDDDEQGPRSIRALGERVARILQEAWDGAEELRREAVAAAASEAEVVERRAEEREARAAAALESAAGRASALEAEAESLRRDAAEEAERVRTDAEAGAEEHRAAVLGAASEEAAALRSSAVEAAEALRRDAAADAERVRQEAAADADRVRGSATAEAEEVRAAARADAQRTVADAESRRDDLEGVIATLHQRRDAALTELDRVRTALEQVVAAPAAAGPAAASHPGPTPRVQ